MSLERRLTEALHRTDDYLPSVDLFARLSRSIAEDQAHRRRIRTGSAAAVAGLGLVASFLRALADHDPDGTLVLPKWSMQAVVFAVLTACLFVFGPAIRRLGKPYLADVFHMSPETGTQFSRLLDIAYYLFFGGRIVAGLDLTEAGSLVPAAGEDLELAVQQVALFLTVLGLVHVVNLLMLPMVGLLFTSETRGARRAAAGSQAPPVSERAQKTDRLVVAIVITGVLLGMVGALLAIAVGISG
jgi:hypothetical protein